MTKTITRVTTRPMHRVLCGRPVWLRLINAAGFAFLCGLDVSGAATGPDDNKLLKRSNLPVVATTSKRGDSQIEVSDQGSDKSIVESFKEFISRPPIVESVDYRMIAPTNMEIGLPDSEAASLAHGTVLYYTGRWQAGDVYLAVGKQRVEVPDAGFHGETMFSRRDRNYCTINRNGFVSIWREDAVIPGGQSAPPTRSFDYTIWGLEQLLRLGIFHIADSPVEWTGSLFAASGFLWPENMSEEVRGDVRADVGGRPSDMIAEYRNRNGLRRYRISYEYDFPLSVACVPNRIEWRFCGKGGEIKVCDARIFSITTNSRRLPESLFDLSVFIPTNKTRVRYYTNGAWYVNDLKGRLSPQHGASWASTIPLEKIKNHNGYYAVAILFSGVILVFMLKAGFGKKTNTHNNERYEN